MVVRPAIISAIMESRLWLVWRSSWLAAAMTLPERQATNMKTGTMTSNTGMMGAATTKMTPRNRIAKGRSATNMAEAPERVLRTVSTSRNRDCQWAAGCASRACNGSDMTLLKSRRPTSTSTLSDTVCMTRDRVWRRT